MQRHEFFNKFLIIICDGRSECKLTAIACFQYFYDKLHAIFNYRRGRKMINDSSRKPKSSSRVQGDQREKLFIVLINSLPHRRPNLLRIFMWPKRIIIA